MDGGYKKFGEMEHISQQLALCGLSDWGFQRCKVFHFWFSYVFLRKVFKGKDQSNFPLFFPQFMQISCDYFVFFFHFAYLVPTYLLKNKQKQCKCQCSDHKHKKGINTHTFADDL